MEGDKDVDAEALERAFNDAAIALNIIFQAALGGSDAAVEWLRAEVERLSRLAASIEL